MAPDDMMPTRRAIRAGFVRIRGTEVRHAGNLKCRRDVHRTAVVGEERLGTRKQSRQGPQVGLPGQIDESLQLGGFTDLLRPWTLFGGPQQPDACLRTDPTDLDEHLREEGGIEGAPGVECGL